MPIRPKCSDLVRSFLVDQTEFRTDLEDKTECLSSLEKFMQIRSQTEVQIRTQIRPDSKIYHDQHITFVYNSQTIALIYDKASSVMQLTSSANIFRRVFAPKHDILNI